MGQNKPLLKAVRTFLNGQYGYDRVKYNIGSCGLDWLVERNVRGRRRLGRKNSSPDKGIKKEAKQLNFD